MIIMPLEIAKIALQLDSTKRFQNSLLLTMSTLFKEKGFKAFTIGYSGVQFRQALWSLPYFTTIGIISKQINALFVVVAQKLQSTSSVDKTTNDQKSIKLSPLALTSSTVLSGFIGDN
jgi:hypothetical protein